MRRLVRWVVNQTYAWPDWAVYVLVAGAGVVSVATSAVLWLLFIKWAAAL